MAHAARGTGPLQARVATLALWASAAGCALAAMACGVAWHAGFWRHRHLFDPQGRYFDAATGVVHRADAQVMVLPALGLLALALLAGAMAWRRRRQARPPAA